MSSHHPIRIGVFDELSQAERAVSGLIEAGFDRDSISFVCPQCSDEEAVSHLGDVHRVRPAGARTAVAAGTGGAIGVALGTLTAGAIAFGTGGVGLLFAGPLLGGAAGGVLGSFLGAMSTRGLEPEIADFYDQALERGKILVSVESKLEGDPSLARAVSVFEGAGGTTFRLEDSD